MEVSLLNIFDLRMKNIINELVYKKRPEKTGRFFYDYDLHFIRSIKKCIFATNKSLTLKLV